MSVSDTQPGQWWLVYVRRVDTGRRETRRTQMPHLVAESNKWWVLACLPEPHKSVQPAQWGHNG